MRRLRQFSLEEDGVALPIMVLALTVTVAVMAVAIDLGHYFLVRNELQRAADAGALAGARRLFLLNYGKNPPPATPDCSGGTALASQIARSNPVDGGNLEADSVTAQAGFWNKDAKTFTAGCSPATNAVRVLASSVVTTFFARIFGVTSANLQTQAIAWMSPVGGVGPGTIPIAINKNYALSGADLTITFNNDIEDTGCWFSKPPDSASASNFKNYINNGSCPPLNVGDTINLQNGVDTSALHDLKSQLINHGGTWDCWLPLVETCKFNQQQDIWGFINFRMTEVDDKGKDKYVKGTAMGLWEAPGTIPGGANNGGLLSSVRLVN